MPTFVTQPPPDPAAAARSRRLAAFGYSGIGVGAALYWLNSPWESPLLNLLAILICFMGVWPMLRWLQRHDQAYPLLEVLQLTLVPFYAIPLLTEHEAVVRYPESILINASWLVLLFQVLCTLGGAAADRNAPPAGRPRAAWWSEAALSEEHLRFTSHTLTLTTAWLFINAFTHWTPPEFTGTLRAVFFGIGTISAFIQARLWGSGLLNQTYKTLLVVNLALQILLVNLSLLLITSLIILLIVLVGYFSSARRIPWLVCVVALPVFAVLHSGKHKMRELYWTEHSPEVSLSAVPDFYREWIGYGLAEGVHIAGHQESAAGHSSLFARASLFQLVCYVVDTVPDHTPYLGGATYAPVLPQVVPRFLWPGKPSPNDSVKMLSVRLGVLTEEQAESTSIGYGLISEAYANFGVYGVGGLALLLGWCARRIALNTADCRTFSAGGIFRILCLAWCLNTEATLSVWLSSLYQACIAVFVPLLLYRSIVRE